MHEQNRCRHVRRRAHFSPRNGGAREDGPCPVARLGSIVPMGVLRDMFCVSRVWCRPAGTGRGRFTLVTNAMKAPSASRHRALSWARSCQSSGRAKSVASFCNGASHRRFSPYPRPRPSLPGVPWIPMEGCFASTYIASRQRGVVTLHGLWPTHRHHDAAAAICQLGIPTLSQALRIRKCCDASWMPMSFCRAWPELQDSARHV